MVETTQFEREQPETRVGKAFFEKLLTVHGILRADLATVRRLSDEVTEGLAAEDLNAELSELKTNGPLWQLRVNCLQYCQLLHGHHTGEDVELFPRLRAANPEIAPAVDQLIREHQVVSDLLDEIEADAERLAGEDSVDARARISTSLSKLSEALLAHLEFEEEAAGPTIRRLVSLG